MTFVSLWKGQSELDFGKGQRGPRSYRRHSAEAGRRFLKAVTRGRVIYGPLLPPASRIRELASVGKNPT